MQDHLIKPEYFTHAVVFKTAVAGGLVSTELFGRFCTGFGGCTYVAWLPDLILILFGMMVLDMLTGVLKAGVLKQLKSRLMGEGMRRKVAVFAVIGATIMLEMVFRTHGMDMQGLLSKWTTSWFIAVETLSLYENAQAMGVRVPSYLKDAARKLKKIAGLGGKSSS